MDDKLIPELYYHIYNHANGYEQLFHTNENYRFFLQQYAKHIYPVADTLAYCLIPNHFHLLVRIRNEEVLLKAFPKFQTLEKLIEVNYISKQFSNFFSSYTQAFNKLYNRRGSLFIKNFKRKVISDESYYTKLIHYIHANPVHHGFTKTSIDWPWSSYHAFISEKKSKINRKAVLQWFGSKEAFIEFHEQPLALKPPDLMQ